MDQMTEINFPDFQKNSSSPPDRVLSMDEYLEWVSWYHQTLLDPQKDLESRKEERVTVPFSIFGEGEQK